MTDVSSLVADQLGAARASLHAAMVALDTAEALYLSQQPVEETPDAEVADEEAPSFQPVFGGEPPSIRDRVLGDLDLTTMGQDLPEL